MLKVMLQKLWHKKWIVLCLIMGSMLLTATVISFPLYRNAAFNRMLIDEFQNYLTEQGEWPAKNQLIVRFKKDKGGKNISRTESFVKGIYDDLGVKEKETISFFSLERQECQSLMNRADLSKLSLHLGFLSNLPEHINIVAGELYSEDGYADDGSVEVIISESCMIESNLLVGETIEFTYLKALDGSPLRIKVVGVYRPENASDFYWQISTDDLATTCMMREELYREIYTGENAGKYTMTCTFITMFDYKDLSASNAAHLLSRAKYLTEESSFAHSITGAAYKNILESFEAKRIRIDATLTILQIPVLVLLCAFLFMICGQMYDMERNEISVIKSRGSSGGQIFRLYLYQSIFLSLIGAGLGVPLGMLFCRVLGSAQNFLEFDITRRLDITFSKDVFRYLAGAVAASVLIMAIPAIKHSRLTIVKLKQSNALRRKSWWEKLFLDVICLGVSLYGYYSFSKSKDLLAQSVLQGESLDPLLYISSSLFIIGMGLLFLRLQPLFIQLIYLMGRRFWHPASYASFMENIKNGRKQQFIMLFMILTISLGMYHSTVARTILQNAKENAQYLGGADIIVQEVWTDNSAFLSQGNVALQYTEPDYSKYADLANVEAYTKVVYDTKAYMKQNSEITNITLMGIHTREYGEITSISDALLKKPYYEYLNELALDPNGLLVSRNFESSLGYKVGDSITFTNGDGKQASGTILDFFDYWPAYAPTTLALDPDGSVSTTSNYQVIANIATLQKNFGITPYEVWMKLKPGATSDDFYRWVEDNRVSVRKYVDKEADIRKVITDPLLQGTNGVLTMGFIVTIILCATGYLIYWILSILSREMQFGILRACGMHKGELFHMLMNEQIFSGVLSILAGIGIGKMTSRLFVPMLQTAYAASNQVLPMQLITNSTDMIRLYSVIAGVMAVCLAVLILLVFKLNVTKALKLGEE